MDNSTIRYNLTTAGNTSQTITITEPNWGSTWYDSGTVNIYTSPADLPPVSPAVAEDDLEWLRDRVNEIEEFSRLAA